MEKKPGRPDMKPEVKRRMAATDPLGNAVPAAPAPGRDRRRRSGLDVPA